MSDVEGKLREAAQAHQPDRERMLARVRNGMAGAHAPRAHRQARAVSWSRVTLATLAVGATLVAGAFTASSALNDGERDRQTVAAPDDTGILSTESGPLWSDGSVDPHSNTYWAQSNITLQSGEPLAAFTLEVRIAQTGGVATTGTWQTLPGDDFEVSVRRSDGATVYRWTLKAGRTVPAGRHVFAGQYNHTPGGRDAVNDTYATTATTAGGGRYEVGGAF
ncbi:hypothetical protein [Streptomyces sp. H34-S4]|uniref:hypothetical protein n=1 Tax=Streptomyces sp. H34-S4 TaxID=2996463 RepID=UPI00226FDE72|nr:hypothetical protein [Streptomyces sp. H34-S4]MCY0936068.1 hypothetical protein [Streptomyces sp. H34-S4]